MSRYAIISACQEDLEYHGSTAIERVRRQNGAVRRDWLFFDSAEEAAAYFFEFCACLEAA